MNTVTVWAICRVGGGNTISASVKHDKKICSMDVHFVIERRGNVDLLLLEITFPLGENLSSWVNV